MEFLNRKVSKMKVLGIFILVLSLLFNNTVSSFATSSIVEKETKVTADKTALQNAINNASQKVETDYTKSTWESFKQAKLVYSNEDATTIQVEYALQNLIQKESALERIQNSNQGNIGGNTGGGSSSGGASSGGNNTSTASSSGGNASPDKKIEQNVLQKVDNPVSNIEFSDVKVRHWAKPAIDYVSKKQYFVGNKNSKFEPNRSITRAEFITVLGRMAKIDKNNYKSGDFKDVNSSAFYLEYVNWAKQNNIKQN